MIEGVKIKKLKWIADERGRLMEILRGSDQIFRNFAQVYITTAYPGVVKAWHYHKKQTDSIAIIKGMAKLVLYDSRDDSPTKGEIMEVFAGDFNPLLVQVPPFVLHGFKGIGESEAIFMNIPTEEYNPQQPDEYRLDPHNGGIPYDWNRRDG
ncbi:MAG: dTDP-4-dehydrorhamnose 3,5-epimerase family protein [Candidatus Schekmanbacteria bacterium]|nr:dTDP-4-dehydrorhamnose 3,5-epimerase family protein [Candidatus Schekmanbacteria bacterium]